MRIKPTSRGSGGWFRGGQRSQSLPSTSPGPGQQGGRRPHILLLDSHCGESGVGMPFLAPHESGGPPKNRVSMEEAEKETGAEDHVQPQCPSMMLLHHEKNAIFFSKRKIKWDFLFFPKQLSLPTILYKFCSVAQSCPILCNPMDCSTPGFPVLQHLLELAQTHVHWVSDAIQPSHPDTPFPSWLLSFPASGSFLISQFFTSGGQSIGASASEAEASYETYPFIMLIVVSVSLHENKLHKAGCSFVSFICWSIHGTQQVLSK